MLSSVWVPLALAAAISGSAAAGDPEPYCLAARHLGLAGIRLAMPVDSVRRVLGQPIRESSATSSGSRTLVYRQIEVTVGQHERVIHLATVSPAAGMPAGVRINQSVEEVASRLGAPEDLQDLEEVTWTPPLCEAPRSFEVTFLWVASPGPFDPERAYPRVRRLARIDILQLGSTGGHHD